MMQNPGRLWTCMLTAFIFVATADTIEAAEILIDCSAVKGRLRALHGVNNGPLNFGDTIDVSQSWRELAIPHTRLHDSEWPRPDIVDIHAVFPQLLADAKDPANYRFALTDDYLKPIVAAGSAIVYRLGESIEHTPHKHFVHPPKDVDQWAEICLGIIRHYNHGWAEGFKYNIKYWEIWNEPENRPAMWTGTDEQYFKLYTTAAKKIKAQYPDLKVGGPAAGATGKIVDGRFVPIEFLNQFITHLKREQVPLDFFSWHTYTNDPFKYRPKAAGIRRWLDEHGFEKAEIHLNEWNYLPDNDWGPTSRQTSPQERTKWYDRMGGMEGAAFAACVLSDLQDAPVDVANMFTGDTNPFGLFTRYGVPRKNFYAFKAFAMMMTTPQRIQATTIVREGATMLVATDQQRKVVQVMLSNYSAKVDQFALKLHKLQLEEGATWELLTLDDKHDLIWTQRGDVQGDEMEVRIKLPAPGVALLRIKANIKPQ